MNRIPPATWGSGDTATDWRLAAQRCGNALQAINPNLLIIVEGIDTYNDDGYWWGGNLEGVRDYPVQLNVANQLVYSPHDYGSGVASQPWFSAPDFPSNLPGVWDTYWGYIFKNNIAPVIIGEFGGRNYDTASNEGMWQNELVSYIKTNAINWTYWCLNPNSADTGGILADDWTTVVQGKIAMLKPVMYPLVPGSSSSTPAPATPTPITIFETLTPTLTPTPTIVPGTPVPTVGPATPPPPPVAIKVQFYNQNTGTSIVIIRQSGAAMSPVPL